MILHEWLSFIVAAGIILIVFQLRRMCTYIHQMMASLRSLDAELFHLAQEQNPNYGICDNCGRRGIVRHVIPKDGKTEADSHEMFYCQACWWMSDSVQLGSDDKHFRDRLTDRDEIAARIGPG